MRDPNIAEEKFKSVFCERMGITLSHYFDSHSFVKNKVECELNGIMKLSIMLESFEGRLILFLRSGEFTCFQEQLGLTEESKYHISEPKMMYFLKAVNDKLKSKFYNPEQNQPEDGEEELKFALKCLKTFLSNYLAQTFYNQLSKQHKAESS